MSRFTIANLPRMEVAALSEQLVALKSPDNSLAIIDVRDGGTDCPLPLTYTLSPTLVASVCFPGVADIAAYRF